MTAADPSGDDGACEDELSRSRRLVDDQRDVNQRLVVIAIEAQERRDEAAAAAARALHDAAEQHTLAEFRERFVGIVGHDLRNPLNSVIMNAEAMLEVGLDDGQRRRVERIRRGGLRMERIIAQLLDLTRARLGGGIPLTRYLVDLSIVARHVVDELDARAVHLELLGDLTGTWDPDRLADVLSNLTGNALDHATTGTVVEVVVRADRDHVVIEIGNHGPAIAPDLLPTLFQPFRSGHQTPSARPGHLGLGLYIADQIVRGHGGNLDARSCDGVTTFAIRLPRQAPLADPVPPAAPGQP